MTALVVDASALVPALTLGSPRGHEIRSVLRSAVCHAPHLIDAEVGNSLRAQVIRGDVPRATAEWGLRQLPEVIHHRYGHAGVLGHIAWQLRETVTFYGALYAALASLLDVPLVTADARLSRAPGLPCRVELVG